MALTPEQLKARNGKLTASAIGTLIAGDDLKIFNLYRELIGDPAYERENLDHVWAVQLGNTTEDLNLNWYERKTGNSVSRRGEVVIHVDVEWAACTLDGWIEALQCPIECKHVGGWESFEAIVRRYAAQCQWQIDIMRSHQCVFSVIEGAKEPRYEIVDNDPDFSAELWARAEHFMGCVNSLTPPVDIEALEAPKTVKKWRDVNFQGNNRWADQAAEWLEHRQSVKIAESAETQLKQMVPPDCKKAFGHGVIITRTKNNRLTLKVA